MTPANLLSLIQSTERFRSANDTLAARCRINDLAIVRASETLRFVVAVSGRAAARAGRLAARLPKAGGPRIEGATVNAS